MENIKSWELSGKNKKNKHNQYILTSERSSQRSKWSWNWSDWLGCPWWSGCPPLRCCLFSDTPQYNGLIWLGLQGSLNKTNYKTLKMLQLRKWLHRQQAQWTTAYLQRWDVYPLLLKTISFFFCFISKMLHCTYWKTIKYLFSSWCVSLM